MVDYSSTKLALDELKEDITEMKRDLKESSKESQNEFKALREGFNDLKLLVAGNYVTKEELDIEVREVKEELCKKCDIIQKDIDKNEEKEGIWNKLYITFILGTVGMFYYIYSLISQIMARLLDR